MTLSSEQIEDKINDFEIISQFWSVIMTYSYQNNFIIEAENKFWNRYIVPLTPQEPEHSFSSLITLFLHVLIVNCFITITINFIILSSDSLIAAWSLSTREDLKQKMQLSTNLHSVISIFSYVQSIYCHYKYV